MDYPEKSIKFDPETFDVAVRTRLPDQGSFAGMAWLVASSAGGARNASSAEVAGWVDVPSEVLSALVVPGSGS